MPIAVAVALAAGAVGWVVLRRTPSSTSSGSDPIVYPTSRAGSVEVKGAPPFDAGVATPAGTDPFVVRYRVLEAGVPAPHESEETVTVQPPFDVRAERTIAGKADVVEITRLGRRWSQQGDAPPLNLEVPPAWAPAIPVRSAALIDAVGGGVMQRREVRDVAGRRCQVYRSGERLTADHLTVPSPSAHVDSCVDGSGIIVEEVVVTDGHPTTRRLALEVEHGATVGDTTFAIPEGPVLDAPSGGGVTKATDPNARPVGTSYELASPPAGFARVGRYQVIPPQPENFTDPQRAGYRRAATTDVFASAGDVLVIEQGGTLEGHDAFAGDPPGKAVDVAPVGAGEAYFSGTGAEVRVKLGGGRYLRVMGTLPLAALVAAAKSLTTVEG
ncbi:MAG: hypothetical protein QOF60_2547 [Actinomycetota bacterium]|nr:hypothetical protein [Actinomycetota bacterium]